MWKKSLNPSLNVNDFRKKCRIFTLSTLIMWICGGCGVKNEESYLYSGEESKYIHTESTLSTEMSTKVDNSVEYDEDKSETQVDTESETVDNVDKNVEYVDEPAYYYPFFSVVYRTAAKKKVDNYNGREYALAYAKIRGESIDDYFAGIEWIMRNGEISLSLEPGDVLFPENNEDAYIWMARCMHAFELIEKEHGSDENWRNPDSLKPQFYCHVLYARQNKKPWNIEPFRTETDFLRIVISKGNPAS